MASGVHLSQPDRAYDTSLHTTENKPEVWLQHSVDGREPCFELLIFRVLQYLPCLAALCTPKRSTARLSNRRSKPRLSIRSVREPGLVLQLSNGFLQMLYTCWPERLGTLGSMLQGPVWDVA